MEIKMNKNFTFDEVAKEIGCSVEDIQKLALENGLLRRMEILPKWQ